MLWGVRTCEELAALPVLQLSERLGQEGVRLHELARGARVRSLVLAEPGICFEEEIELEEAVEELEPLSFLLGRLLDQFARVYRRVHWLRRQFMCDLIWRFLCEKNCRFGTKNPAEKVVQDL